MYVIHGQAPAVRALCHGNQRLDWESRFEPGFPGHCVLGPDPGVADEELLNSKAKINLNHWSLFPARKMPHHTEITSKLPTPVQSGKFHLGSSPKQTFCPKWLY